MRAGVTSTVQQTLTPEAAAVLKHAVAEACKRGHAQTTPLHVAATLLVAPSSPLRRACLQTHQNSTTLPQCRGLELCFNIALERLQAAQSPIPGGQPSYSNALVAALKRAQAHQRRGCPEQQQQPLLAVKVELEQLVISILDDPSVSRVMREAGFNSTDVKSHLEEIMANTMAAHHSVNYSVTDSIHLPLSSSAIDQMGFRFGSAPSILGGFPLPHHRLPAYNGGPGALSQERVDIQMHMRPLRTQSSYTNPILLKPIGDPMIGVSDDSRRVIDVLMRKRMRNPILVGDSIPRLETVVRDVMQRLERGDVPEQLQGVKFVPLKAPFMTLMSDSKEELTARFSELSNSLRDLITTGGAVICLGDLQWLLQLKASAPRMSGFCPVQHIAYEIKELLSQYRDTGRIWLLGTATSQTYMSCQVQCPTLEGQLELQPVPLATSRHSSLPSRYKLQEIGINGTESSQTLSLLPSPLTPLNIPSLGEENGELLTCCSECMAKYEKEALLLREQEGQGQSDSPVSCSSSVETPTKLPSEQSAQPALPLWLQKALPVASSPATPPNQIKDKRVTLSQKLLELQKKWNQTCRSLHVDRTPNLNMSLDMRQQTSPSSSQVSGGTSRCQEQAHSLLRDTSTRSNKCIPAVGLYPGMNGNIHSRPITSYPQMPMLSNGHVDVHKRLQEDSTGCSPSKRGLPWMALPAATPELPSTEACAPSFDEKKGPLPKMFHKMDLDALTKLCKGLQKKVGWQPGVISTIANTVMQCRSGLGKRRGPTFKGDAWLLFLGYDRPGKRQMAEALAELIFGEGKKPICLNFGGQQDLSSPATWSLGLSTVPSRGRMPVDQLAEAVRHNPSSVVLLEDLEQADSMFTSSLLRAIDKGKLVDSSGREISFNNVIVVMTSSLGVDSNESKCTRGSKTDFLKQNPGSGSIARLHTAAEDASSEEFQSSCKRKGEWDADDIGCTNKKSFLDLDLNMSADANDVVTSSTPQKTRGVEGHIPTLNKEEVFSCARKTLPRFCDLADAVVVFESPL